MQHSGEAEMYSGNVKASPTLRFQLLHYIIYFLLSFFENFQFEKWFWLQVAKLILTDDTQSPHNQNNSSNHFILKFLLFKKNTFH